MFQQLSACFFLSRPGVFFKSGHLFPPKSVIIVKGPFKPPLAGCRRLQGQADNLTGGDTLTELEYTDAVKRNSQRVFLIALSFTRQREDAEDVMQNVFFKLWKHRDRLGDPTHVDKWLTRVTVNESRSLLRFRRDTVSYEEIEELCAAPSFSKEQELICAVMQLPKDQRTAIHLYYYEELSVREIAELLHITQSAAKKRLSRGRETLRKKLEEEQNNEP